MRVRLPSGARFARDAWLLIAVSGVLSVSFYGIHNLLRVFYVLRLGHGPEYVGLYSASSALTYMAMGLPSGALGQRYGTRRIMLLAIVIVVLGMIALPLTEVLPTALHAAWPIISQIILTSGWPMINVNIIPGLVTATAPESRGSVYALNGAVRGVGTLVGTLVGGLLPGFFAGLFGQTLDAATPYGYSLWVGAAVSIVAIVPIALLRPARPSATASSGADTTDPFPIAPMALLAGHIFLVHGGWATLQAFGNAFMDTDLRLTASAIGLITGVAQLVSTGAALVTPRLVRRAGDGATLILSGLGMGLSLLPLVLFPHWSTATFGRVGNLALEAMWLPALQVYQMERVGERWRSMAYGIVNTVMGLSFGTVSLAGGYIVAAGGYRAVFLVGAGLCVAASVIMGGMVRGERRAVKRAAPVPGETTAG
jgi:MFS family permease